MGVGGGGRRRLRGLGAAWCWLRDGGGRRAVGPCGPGCGACWCGVVTGWRVARDGVPVSSSLRSLLLRLLLPEAASTLHPHTPGSQGPGGALFPFSRIPWFTYLHGIQSNTLVFKGIGDSLNLHQGNGYDEPSTNTPSPHQQNPPIHVPEEHPHRISMFVPEERTLWNGRRPIP